MKKAFTLIEMIVVIVVAGILSAGTFIALKEIYLRAAKSKAISELSQTSQLVSSEVASLLYDRVPSSVIGYNTTTKEYRSIYDINKTYNVLEWISLAKESFLHRDYSGFVDMNASNPLTNTLVSPDTNVSSIAATIQKKFDTTQNVYDNDLVALIFAGSFDSGSLALNSDFDNSFGWHGGDAKLVYKISSSSINNLLKLKSHPSEIYEKYYLVDSAYALARGVDLNKTVMQNNCDLDLSGIKDGDFNSTMFLFYDYRPWKKETFCADPNITGGDTREGNVTIMATEVEGFRVDIINNNLQFSLTLKIVISSDKKHSVTISKQKVIF
jgi:prepilin-type N-terminal cleavage/methylation domain-containing protein